VRGVQVGFLTQDLTGLIYPSIVSPSLPSVVLAPLSDILGYGSFRGCSRRPEVE